MKVPGGVTQRLINGVSGSNPAGVRGGHSEDEIEQKVDGRVEDNLLSKSFTFFLSLPLTNKLEQGILKGEVSLYH
jgi:hypothetical protein